MQFAEIPENDTKRLKNLAEYSILDSLPEREYNEITKLASYICQTPISLLSIIDEKRQWVKSMEGIEMGDVDRDYAVCAHAINQPGEILIVPDLREDIRFHDNPVLINGAMVFYAGVPLVSPEGYALGTLCVLDHKPRNLNQLQIDTMKALANQIISLLELRRSKSRLEVAVKEIEEKNHELERFAYVVAHDIKSPLNNISGLTKHLIKRYTGALEKEVMEIIGMLDDSSERVKWLVDGILEYSRSETYVTENKEELDVRRFLEEIVQYFAYYKECEFTLNCSCPKITANKTVLSQILINLVSNAVKYNDKKNIMIEIDFSGTPENYTFSVKDNGPGITKQNQQHIFEIFKVFTDSDRFGKRGNGIGLATVKKLTEKLKGKIMLDSDLGKGSVFKLEFNS